jgi:hypothetical protein
VTTLFGVAHVGGPAKPLPTTEIRTSPAPDMPLPMEPVPVRMPRWEEFEVEGQPLFVTIQAYLTAASSLVSNARGFAASVHGTNSLTPPPT